MPKKTPPWTLIALATILVVTIITVTFGEGRLNLGAFNLAALKNAKKVARVASADCPQNATKNTDNHCVFTVNMPLEYYVIKDGDNFVIWGPSINDIFTQNNFNITEGTVINGLAYNMATGLKTPLDLTFRYIEKNGKQVPAFSFTYSAAASIKGSRLVKVEIPDTNLEIGFDSFNIPDKNLVHS